VCRRSSTSCATCRHYRRSVAGQLGYCGLDARRQPLTGEEIRGCWEGWPVGAGTTMSPPTIAPARPSATDRPPLEFIEVTSWTEPAADDHAAEPVAASPPPLSEPGWSLWGDADG
jgi:hypothetical protein